eukprot:m.20216 g.20216  ORF g.20216 m.20216 type:complete len:222 (-) comp5226_c0_seq1:1519-2184(-)
MPKSKRARMVSLTRTNSKGREGKKALIEDVQECIDEYASIYVFSVDDMRNSKLKDLRVKWRDSRFFFGKNKVIALALGSCSGDEYRTNTHHISERLVGNVGLLFTNRKEKAVKEWFANFSADDFARTGNKATETVDVEAGPLTQFPHSLEPQLRKLGMPTSLVKGVVTLDKDFNICKKDQALSPEQARLLKLFGYKQATFRIKLKSVFSQETMTDYAENEE